MALDRTWVRRPGHEVKFSAEEERIWALILPRLAGEPYRPPRVRDIAKAMGIDEAFVRRLMRMAARRGDVEEIAHDHFFLRPVVEKMARDRHRRRGRVAGQASSRPPTSATGSTTAARWRSRFWSFSTGTGLRSAARICAASIRRASSSSRPRRRKQTNGGVPLPVGRPDFKSGWGRQTVSGGFDSHPPPPPPREVSAMTPAAMALVAEFEAAAKTAQAAEDGAAQGDGRADRAPRAAARVRLPPHAPHPHSWRISAGTPEASEPEEVWQAQRQAVRDELGWTERQRGATRRSWRGCSRLARPCASASVLARKTARRPR